jgi:hypothetical protein
VSVAVERAGFVDSYRSAHPDPAVDPGLTWWADRPDVPGWNPGRHAPEDRIDFVWAAGEASATSSLILGERSSPIADITVQPWPSDHRGVVSTFEVTAGTPPLYVAPLRRLLPVGQDLEVVFHANGEAGEAVAIVPAGGDPSTDALAEEPTGDPVPADGILTFPTGAWAAGDYEAVLLDPTGVELSRAPVWLKEPGAPPEISTGAATYAVGEPIDVHWSNVRGERWDWVSVYRRGADPHVAWYLLWLYTGSTVEGSAVLGDEANGRWPLKAGDYSVYLLRDDSYKKVAEADFTIEG